MNRRLISRTLIALILIGVSGWAAEYRFPQARIPYVQGRAPEMDGVVDPDEYRDFAAISGMVTLGAGHRNTIVPAMQQVVWYLGYDDQFFYIAMRSPNPPGSWPKALMTSDEPESDKILFEDHVEIQIAKDRSQALIPPQGFFKIMANPRGACVDEHFHNGTPGSEHLWSIYGDVKSTVTKEHWDLEIKADKRAFDVEKFEGQNWVLQLVRADSCDGIYFAGWVAATWTSFGQFGQITFDPRAPVFRMLDVGELARGQMDLKIELIGQVKEPIPVDIEVRLTDTDGKTVFEHKGSETAVAGEVKTLNLKKDVALSERGNRLELLATYANSAGGRETLYHVRAPVIYHDEEYWARHIVPWLEHKPKGEFQAHFAYWPSYGVASVRIDTDIFGIEEDVAAASAFELEISSKSRFGVWSKSYGRAAAEIKNRRGNSILRDLDLPEGEYVARLRLIGADGKRTVGEREIGFVRRRYEWEGGALGVSDQVIPPFSPITVSWPHLHVWSRRYTVGADGLLSRIRAGGGAGPEEILRAPMRLIAKQGEKSVALADARGGLGDVNAGRVDVRAAGVLGGAGLTITSRLEYDGWYEVEIELKPGDKPVEFDRLTLEIPVWADADTMYVQRNSDGRRGNYFGEVPAGEGLVWSSAELPPMQGWGSFVPVVFLGTGDKGLWFFAEENRGWTMSEEVAAVELHRNSNGVVLCVNLLAAPTRIERARRFTFAFLADPVKEIENERQWAWGRLSYSHNTWGYRHWGRSVDGFDLEQADRDALRAVLTDPRVKGPKDWDNEAIPFNSAFRNVHYPAVGEKRQMLVLYGSTYLTGLRLPEFDTYGGEWLGRNNWVANPDSSYKNGWNIQGSKRWVSDRDLSVQGVNFNRSFEDCFVWHHYLLLRDVPVNGTWWDNLSNMPILDYDPDTKEFYSRWNVFSRRRMMKRLNTLGWELGRRPWWINNMHVDWSFNQVSWHIENDFSARPTVMEFYESMAQFRAMVRIKRGIVHQLDIRPVGAKEAQVESARSIWGMALLHDIGSRHGAGAALKAIDGAVGFFDGAEFVPYWRNSHLLRIDTPDVYVSLYRGRGKAVAVVVNRVREEKEVAYRLESAILGGNSPRRIYDGETGEEFATAKGEAKPGTFHMPPVGVRLLVIE